jgi:hypothetical protein
MFVYTAEPGTPSADALRLLAAWQATPGSDFAPDAAASRDVAPETPV